MPKRVDVFYAFPSRPESLAELINSALGDLRANQRVKDANLRFRPWPEMAVAGKRLITEITETIDRCDIFACDVTYPNPNVAFELGFAIGRFKRLWIALNTSIEDASNQYKRLYEGIIGAGYSGYVNHNDLANSFLEEHVWRSLDQYLLNESYRRPAPRPELPTLLYVRPLLDTEPVIRAVEVLERSDFSQSLVVDDPRENAAPTLEWYAEKIHIADAVVVHLLAENQRHMATYNPKASFVAGLAYGFRKPVLMLAHTPFECPTDYRSLLKEHGTAQQSETELVSWLGGLNIPRRRPRRTDEVRRGAQTLELRNLSIGEPVAENESGQLDEYFIETSVYYEALESQTSVMVGRRGTGKTANLLALQTAFGADKRHHVCTVKPVGYEIEGLIRLLQEDLHSAERGYLIESLWKFLIYSELAASVFAELKSRPVYEQASPEEASLVEYVQTNSDVILAPFSQRIDRAIRSLSGIGTLIEPDDQRARISEILHAALLGRLRQLLGLVLGSKTKVAILIDNLDEPWGPGQDSPSLSQLLLGLLRVTQDISEDFQHQDYRQKRINISLTTFIRSDIFAFIRPLAKEQDKWPIRRVVWTDRNTLLRVIDERLKHAVPSKFVADDIWEQLFSDQVVGLATKEFIVNSVLARPRDIIYLVKQAVAFAVNRGHSMVLEEDLLDAREAYSRFVFQSILAEDDPERGKLESVLYEFAGAKRVMTASEVASRIQKADVNEQDTDFYLNLLCDLNFLAIQTATGFSFASDESNREMLRTVATKLAVDRQWVEESYEISPAFYQALQIE